METISNIAKNGQIHNTKEQKQNSYLLNNLGENGVKTVGVHTSVCLAELEILLKHELQQCRAASY